VPALSLGAHTITATYSGAGFFLGSSITLVQNVYYDFGGFQAPLTNNATFGTGRTISIKFQLSDFNGTLITSLAAVSSLQAQLVNSSGTPLGQPFAVAGVGGTGLQN